MSHRVLVLVLVVIASVACTAKRPSATRATIPKSPTPRTSMTSTSGNSVILRIDSATNRVAHVYSVGRDPRAVAVGEGSVWVANAGEDSVLRLDAETGRIQATIHVGHQPRGIAIGGGVPGVWVNTVDQVQEIDSRSSAITLTTNVDDATGTIALGEAGVWVTGVASGLDQFDPSTGHLKRDFVVGQILCSSCATAAGVQGPWSGDHQRGAPPSVTVGLGWVWAVGAPPPEDQLPVWRIDPATGSSSPIRVPFSPIGVAVGEDSVWSVGTNGDVARIDRRGKVMHVTEATPRGATKVAVSLDAVWILNPILGTVTRIDLETNRVAATIDVGPGATAIAVGGRSVWVTRTQGS